MSVLPQDHLSTHIQSVRKLYNHVQTYDPIWSNTDWSRESFIMHLPLPMINFPAIIYYITYF